jgi:hypothetical protein
MTIDFRHDALPASYWPPILGGLPALGAQHLDLEVLRYVRLTIAGSVQELIRHVLLLGRPAQVARVHASLFAVAACVSGYVARRRLWPVSDLAHYSVRTPNGPVGSDLTVPAAPREWPDQALVSRVPDMSHDPLSGHAVVVKAASGIARHVARFAGRLVLTPQDAGVVTTPTIFYSGIAAATFAAD